MKQRSVQTVMATAALVAAVAANAVETTSCDIVIYGSSPAASMAVAGGTRSCASAVQDVSYDALAARLVADGQVIPSQAITENVPPVATAECQGNSIRLYSAPLSYEVAKGGKVVVPRTEIGLCVDDDHR